MHFSCVLVLINYVGLIICSFDRFLLSLLSHQMIQSSNGVKKIKTLGDCYVASSGILEVTSDHASNLISFGIEMHDQMVALQEIPDLADTFFKLRAQTTQDNRLTIRVGINSGSVVGGVVGDKKAQFDVWGDTVDVANLMESEGVPGKNMLFFSSLFCIFVKECNNCIGSFYLPLLSLLLLPPSLSPPHYGTTLLYHQIDPGRVHISHATYLRSRHKMCNGQKQFVFENKGNLSLEECGINESVETFLVDFAPLPLESMDVYTDNDGEVESNGLTRNTKRHTLFEEVVDTLVENSEDQMN